MIVKSVKRGGYMKINAINQNSYNNTSFQMRLVQDPSMIKYIDSFHFKNEQNNLKEAINIIGNYIGHNPETCNIKIAVLDPARANLVKSGTYDEFVSKINLVIQGEEFTATLEDNETSRAFVNQLPLTMTMNELNGNEKYYYLDKNLPSQATSVSQIETGDLMLYGDDCLVLFYDTFKTSYRYTRIGKLDQIIQLKELVGNGTIEVSISK